MKLLINNTLYLKLYHVVYSYGRNYRYIELRYYATLNIDEGLTSSNFGPGIELLMNDKKPSGEKGGSSDINLDDLTDLKKELNDAVEWGMMNLY